MSTEEAILHGTARLAADPGNNLSGRAWLLSSLPDVLTDGSDPWVPDSAIRDGDGGYITLGMWPDGALSGYVEVDLSIVDAALPRLGRREQIGRLEVWLETGANPSTGVFVLLDTYPDISVDLQLGAPSRFSFTVPFRKRNPLNPLSSTRPLPAPQNALGNPFGLRRVNIQAAYLTATGVKRIPLLTGGYVQEAPLVHENGGSVLRVSGTDRWGALENRIEAGFSIPPGSGLPRAVVWQMLAEHGHGWDVEPWPGGATMHHDYQVVGEELMPRLAELADADNRLLYVDVDVLKALPEVDTTTPVSLVLGPRDLIAAEPVEIGTPSANPPTRVAISGTQQVLKTETGVHTKAPRIALAYSRYPVKVALAKQDSAGDINPTGATPDDDELKLVNRTTTTLTYNGDTLLVEKTEFEAYYNPQVWRYEFETDPDGVDGGGDYADYNAGAYLYDAAAVKNDGTPAYRWPTERFGLIGRNTTTHTYDSRNFLVLSETIKEGWLTLQEAIKVRPNKATTFEATNHEGVRILASGIAAKGANSAKAGERFAGWYGGFQEAGADKTERIRIEHSVTDDGYITATTTTREAWDALPGSGSRYLYGDGTTRNEQEFEFIEVDKVVEQYYTEGEGARRATLTFKYDEIREVIDEPIDGFFPVADQHVDLTPDPALYAGREDLLAQARQASRQEGKSISYDTRSAALETRYPEAWHREEFGLGEDVDDLRRRADTVLSLHSACPVPFTVLLNALIKPGQRVHVQLPEADCDHPVHVIAVSHKQLDRNRATTAAAGRIYVT